MCGFVRARSKYKKGELCIVRRIKINHLAVVVAVEMPSQAVSTTAVAEVPAEEAGVVAAVLVVVMATQPHHNNNRSSSSSQTTRKVSKKE